MSCCFRDCGKTDEAASLRLSITPAPDGDPVIACAHEECFSAERDSSVEPDDPRDHGRVPAKARCAFCGVKLPVIGKHPLTFDVGEYSPPHRFWAHVQCMEERLAPS